MGAVAVALALSPAAAHAAPAFGVVDGPYQGDDAALAAKRAQELGATVMRVLVGWAAVEPRPGQFDWTVYDRYLGELKKRGIRPLLLVEHSPAWAQDGDDLCLGVAQCPPGAANMDSWRTFVRAVVARYTSAAHDVDPVAVEIWNEPNIKTDWETLRGPDLARYADLLRFGAEGVRAVAPALPVLVGGLSPTSITSSRGIAMEAFLQGLYDRGLAGSFDGIAVHPYPQPRRGETSAEPGYERFSADLDRVRAVRDVNNDGPDKPLWITEVGVSDPDEVRPPETQGSMLLSMYDRVAGAPDVAAFLIWRLRQNPGDAGWGLVNADWTPKPAFLTLQQRFEGASLAAAPVTAPARRTSATQKRRAKRKRAARSRRRGDIAAKRAHASTFCLPQAPAGRPRCSAR